MEEGCFKNDSATPTCNMTYIHIQYKSVITEWTNKKHKREDAELQVTWKCK